MTRHLDDDLLRDFMHTFYGYGDYDAPYWFVGMEEASSGTVAEITRRLTLWDERGRRELEHLADWHLDPGPHPHFSGRVSLQPTWNPLMRILLSAEQRSISLSTLRQYQKEELGRPGGETCLLELLPLPSPSTSRWLYAEHSDIPALADRERYRQSIAEDRAARLRARVRRHRPRCVVFYSVNSWYRQWWEHIARSKFESVAGDNSLYRAERQGTHFIICKHPVSFGTPNAYFHRIGKMIAADR